MKLYDTLTAVEREFVPAAGKTVKMYVCGVTPYSSTHVGHALSYVTFDVLRRYLEYLGYEVQHVQNFTDIDDKIIRRARDQEISEAELVERYIDDYFRSMDALNILRAHLYPRATQEVPNIIDTIRGLVDKGYAYAAGGDVFFRVNKSEGYGRLSHRTLDSMIAGSRVQVHEAKEAPVDFVLWKGAKPGEPSWESPWGPGRPGWHIECTAMTLTYLGETLDIHGGGQDLVFPHHENEIAQSEAYTGTKPFVHHWVHNGLLRLGEDKMSKSLGNLVEVEEALQRYSSDAIRLYFLSSHYRGPLNYRDDDCAAMERGVERLRHALSLNDYPDNKDQLDPTEYQERFLAAMDADLNTPKAVAALFDLARKINQFNAIQDAGQAKQSLRDLGGVLGLTFQARRVSDDHLAAKSFIELLLSTREELRKAKQYSLADGIRQGLAQQGVVLEDTSQGTQWRYQAQE